MEQENQSLFDLHIDQQSIGYLSEGARWARFVAVIGFIFCGLMVIVAFFIGAIMSAMMSSLGGGGITAIGGGAFTFLYLIFAAIGFIPCLFLYRFGSQMQTAIKNNQQDKLNTSLSNLKSYFKFIGILFIIMLSFYALAIIGAIIGGLVMR
jgi:hypothetical protein